MAAVDEGPQPPPLPAIFSPIAEGQRHGLLDILRGFAIFGIFLVNIIGFKTPALTTAVTGERWHPGVLNELVLSVTEVLAMGKFVAMFALLFGLGMVLQRDRAAATRRPFGRFFVRRMLVLLSFGIAHGIFLWAGDILAIYAVFGLIGLCFVRCRVRTLFIWIVLILILYLAGIAAMMMVPPDMEVFTWWREWGEWLAVVYSSGTLGEIVYARFIEWAFMVGFAVVGFMPYVFVLFLLGMAFGKVRLLSRLPEWDRQLRFFVVGAIPAGLLLNAVMLVSERRPDLIGLEIAFPAQLVGSILLSLSYMVLIYFGVSKGLWRPLLDRLAAVGRLALTHYLLQSIIANIVFMSWGLGLYGKVPAQAGVLIVIAVFIVQLWVSPLWLRYFQIGPFEWLWRTLAYGRVPPFRRQRA